jgi:Cys-tRNA(Pro)/Cys-tRNA(Cys) deacylase
MAKGTPATVALTKAGVAFTLHEYDYDPDATRIGPSSSTADGAACRSSSRWRILCVC